MPAATRPKPKAEAPKSKRAATTPRNEPKTKRAAPKSKPAAAPLAEPPLEPPVTRGFFNSARRGANGAAQAAEAREGVPAVPVDVGEPADWAGAAVPAPPGGLPPAAHTAREWTAAEAAERLAGFDEVPRADWERIPYGVRVRYFLRPAAPGGAERFQPGGYIGANPLDVAPADGSPPRRYFRFQTGFDPAAGRRVQWVVPYDEVARAFVRLNVGTLFALRALAKVARGINDSYAQIEALVAAFDARLARLEAAAGVARPPADSARDAREPRDAHEHRRHAHRD